MYDSQGFIEEIVFQEDFPPFKKGDKIKFNGEKEVQDLIKFYLKSKGVKDYQKNAERFKINCLLGSNGGGKSRLFDYLLGNPECINNGKLNSYSILDSFFKLSSHIDESVNYRLFNELNLNNFLVNFFNDTITFKDIYSTFLNKRKSFESIIKVSIANWKESFKGEYFDFINFVEYNDDDNKYSVSGEVEYENALSFFQKLNESINNKNDVLSSLGITKEEAICIWLYFSDLFLLIVNHFDIYLSIDDDFTKHMIAGIQGFSGPQEDFETKGLYSYKKYQNYNESLMLLSNFLSINIELFNKNEFDREYVLADDQVYNDIGKYLINIQHNLRALLENLKHIEENIHTIGEQGHLDFTQIYAFKNLDGKEVIHRDFVDKIQGSRYSSQSKYLLVNLLFGYSDIEAYTYGITGNSFSDEVIKKNISSITNLKHFFYDGSVRYAEKYLKEDFIYAENKTIPNHLGVFLSNNFLNIELILGGKSFNNLSAGEKTILTRFTNIYRAFNLSQERKLHYGNTAIVLIDEPDLHLHLDWQRQYIQKLIDVFSILPEDINIHFIIATHSPFIISDLPSECIIKLKGDGEGNTEISYMDKEKQKTFGANYIDLIQDGFFFEDEKLMGSFAETVIGDIAEKRRREITNDEKIEDKENVEKIEKNIGDDFLRDNLLYFKKKQYAKNGY